MHEQEKTLLTMLIEERYQELTCQDIARLVPKLEKCANLEDSVYVHIRNYVRAEKDKITDVLNSVVLNLPYFRMHDRDSQANKYIELSEESLHGMNDKLRDLSFKPKKLRLKFSSY